MIIEYFKNKKWNLFLFRQFDYKSPQLNKSFYEKKQFFRIENFKVIKSNILKKKNKNLYFSFLENFKKNSKPNSLCIRWKKNKFGNNATYYSLHFYFVQIIFLPVINNLRKNKIYFYIKHNNSKKKFLNNFHLNSSLIANTSSIKYMEYKIIEFIKNFFRKKLINE